MPWCHGLELDHVRNCVRLPHRCTMTRRQRGQRNDDAIGSTEKSARLRNRFERSLRCFQGLPIQLRSEMKDQHRRSQTELREKSEIVIALETRERQKAQRRSEVQHWSKRLLVE